MHVVATAGHVDHGKSTLLRALTGMEPDRWEEERRRGLTIDLGFVWATLPATAPAVASPAGGSSADSSLTVAFVDVPGHERFVGNMLAGAGSVRLALFVVAADDGWSAQSQEHLDILDLLGISAAVVAVTKSDLAGDERAEEVAADVARRLAGTSLAGAPVLTVDAVSRRGLDSLTKALAARLDAMPPPVDTGRPRLWVDRAFTIAGAGTVVTGTLSGGALRVGDEVALLPSGKASRIRALQALGRTVSAVEPGSRVAVNLAGVDLEEVRRGDAVVGLSGAGARAALEAWWATDVLDAWVRALPGHEVGSSGAWHLHVGSAETLSTIHPLLGEPVRPQEPAYVRILLERRLPLVSADRFVLREAGRQATLGGGQVLDPDPPGRVRGPDARLLRSDALDRVRDATSPAARLAGLVASSDGARSAGRARAAAGLHPKAAVDGLVEIAGHLVTPDAIERWTAAIEAAARDHHARTPQSPGSSRDVLSAAARRRGCPESLAPGLVDAMAEKGRLLRSGSAYALPEHVPARDEAKRRRREALLSLLTAEPFAPPPLDEVARQTSVGHEELNALVQSGEVVVCGPVAFARSSVEGAVARLSDLEGRVGRFTTAQAREALGTSRKFVVPLLEHLDEVGVTTFDGQTRGLRKGG
ncbi:MAG: selenocysteine-specific translation elongation factor [Nitriliruptorales bacterium]